MVSLKLHEEVDLETKEEVVAACLEQDLEELVVEEVQALVMAMGLHFLQPRNLLQQKVVEEAVEEGEGVGLCLGPCPGPFHH